MIPTQTLSRFVHAQGRKFPNSTGELSELIVSIALGVKIIGKLVSSAGFKGLHGYTGKTNVQGEEVHALDEEADEILVELLGSSGHFGMLVSEERDSVIATEHGDEDAKYLVAFDPLDGSSNLGSNIPVGTIFGIFRKRDENRPAKSDDFLQSGRKLVGAGYSVYGAKTSFVYSCGDGVHGFTLDHDIGEFVLTEENIRVPDRGNTYSVNEGYSSLWSREVLNYIGELKSDNKSQGTPYNGRYVGSLVADFDRTLRKGGVFLHPANSKRPRGKLRLLYECLPLAFIVEAAGGRASDGSGCVLDLTPKNIHDRCPFIVGSKFEVEWFERMNKLAARN